MHSCIIMKYFKAPSEYWQKMIMFAGYALGACYSIILYAVFLWAYFSNDYCFAVSINSLGEAHIEFIMLLFVMPIICIGLYLQYKNLKPQRQMDKDTLTFNYQRKK